MSNQTLEMILKKIALNGEWENSNDEVLKSFGSVSRAGFIPCGSLCYMPNEWETAPYENNAK